MIDDNEKSRGRPSIYTPELRAEFCARVAGGRTVRSVCRDDDMPCRRTITEWLLLDYDKQEDHPAVHDDFLRHYTRAREEQAENIHDEIVEISDDGTNDYVEVAQKNGTKIVFDKEAVMRSRLRVDARLSWLANTAPRKYGKNMKVETQALDKQGEPTDPVESASAARAAAHAVLEAMKKADEEEDGVSG